MDPHISACYDHPSHNVSAWLRLRMKAGEAAISSLRLQFLELRFKAAHCGMRPHEVHLGRIS